MGLERFDFPATGTATESWAPTSNPIYPEFVNDVDLGVVSKRSAGNKIYNQQTPTVCNYYRRVYRDVPAAEREDFENFCRVVGGQPFKFTDEYGITHRVTFADFARSFKDQFHDNWGFGFTLREELAPWPSLSLIPQALRNDLLFFAPLKTGLAAFGRWDSAPIFTRASIATYIDAASGLVKTVGAGVPRFEAQGLLMEETRINRCLYSEQFNNAAWIKGSATVTADNATDPAGSGLADLLTATANNATVAQDLGTIPSSSKAFSIWLKRKTGTGAVRISLDAFATYSEVTLSSTVWTRFTKVQTLANPVVGVTMTISGDEVWAWGAQLEDGVGFETSYIPTVGAIVTRPADVLDYSAVGQINNATLTVFVSVTQNILKNSPRPAFVGAMLDASNYWLLFQNETGQKRPRIAVYKAGNAEVETTGSAGDFVAGVPKVVCATIQPNDVRLYADNVAIGTDSAALLPEPTIYFIGRDLGGGIVNGHLRNIAVFGRVLTSGEIATLSTAFA